MEGKEKTNKMHRSPSLSDEDEIGFITSLKGKKNRNIRIYERNREEKVNSRPCLSE